MLDSKMRIVGKNGYGEYRILGKTYANEGVAIQRALERLYAYEELDLLPGEIKVILAEYERNKKALHKIASGELKNLKALEVIVAETAPKEE